MENVVVALRAAVRKIETVAPYADALFARDRIWGIVQDRTGVEPISEESCGVKLRAFDGSCFLEECVPAQQERIAQAAERLKERIVPKDARLTLAIDRTEQKESFKTTAAKPIKDVSVTRRVHDLQALHKSILASRDSIVDCQASVTVQEEWRVFVNRNKELSSEWSGVSLTLMPFVKSEEGIVRTDSFQRFSNGWEVMDIDQASIDLFLERTQGLARAKRIVPGTYTVLLSPRVTGILAHESFGHGMEADTFLHGRARAMEYVGKRVAPAIVSISEDASIPGTHGSLFFDDEGRVPKRHKLVERGIVRDPIADLLSASKLKLSPSGNGRAESYDRKVFARMTNTFFEAGKDETKDLIKKIKDGYYLHEATSGMEDPKGWGVQIAGILAERIKNGKRTGEYVAEVTMGGYLPDILKNIKGVSKEFVLADDVGYCAKGHHQWVRVASGGPHLLIEGVHLS